MNSEAAGVGPLSCSVVDLAPADVPETETSKAQNVTLYTLYSSSDPVMSLLPYAFSPVRVASAEGEASASLESLRGALFMIVLDMSEPAAVVRELAAFLQAIETLVKTAHCDVSNAAATRAAMEEQCRRVGGSAN